MKNKLSSVRLINTQRVMQEIIKNKAISRVQISKNISLNKASVSEITNSLIEQELIIEMGTGESSSLGGRRPTFLSLNKNAGVAIGVDVGIQTVRYQVTLLDGSLLEQGTFENKHKLIVYNIKTLLNSLSNKFENFPYKVVGASISIQGIVHNNKIFFTPNYNIVDIESLEDCFDFPIYYGNEANFAVLAHKSINKESSIAAITLRTGIGSGILFNNQIYLGHESGAGELGHTIVFPKGKLCPCGNRGCLEQYASEKNIVSEYNRILNRKDLTLDDFIKDCNLKDSKALKILVDASEFLAIGITNFISLYATPHIYLVGRLTDEIDGFVEMIQLRISGIFSRDVILTNSPYGKGASAYGACINSIEKFLENTH